MSSLIKKKIKNLVLKSKIIKDYPLLEEFLIKYDNPVLEDLKNSDISVQNIFNNKIFTQIFTEAKKEWVLNEDIRPNPLILDDVKKNNRVCEYCGFNPLKEIFYIQNIYNKKTLEVGNKCVLSLDIKSKGQIEILLSSARKVYRLNYLNNKIPGIQETIAKSNVLVDDGEIIVPFSVCNAYCQNSKELKSLFSSYLSAKTLDKDLDEIEAKITHKIALHSKYERDINEYIASHKQEVLIAKKGYEHYLRNTKGAIEQMYSTGIVGKLGISQLHDTKFMKAIVPQITHALLPYDITLYNQYKKGYQYQTSRRKEIFYISLENMVSFIGEAFYNEPISDVFTVADFIEKSTIVHENSLNIAIGWLLSKTAYTFDINMAYDEIVFYIEPPYYPPATFSVIPTSTLETDIVEDTADTEPVEDAYVLNYNKFYKKFESIILTRKNLDIDELMVYILNGDQVVLSEYMEARR